MFHGGLTGSPVVSRSGSTGHDKPSRNWGPSGRRVTSQLTCYEAELAYWRRVYTWYHEKRGIYKRTYTKADFSCHSLLDPWETEASSRLVRFYIGRAITPVRAFSWSLYEIGHAPSSRFAWARTSRPDPSVLTATVAVSPILISPLMMLAARPLPISLVMRRLRGRAPKRGS